MQQSIRLALAGALLIALLVGALPVAASATAQSVELTEEALANATYLSDYSATGEITLVDGKAEEEIAPGSASKLVVTLVEPTAYGDLDGDGVDDAAVLLASDSGGSGAFIDLHAVLNENGEPVDAASTFLGDRVQVNSLVIEDGLILIEMVTQGPNDPMCCPTQQEMRTYQLVGGELVEISDEALSLETLGNLTYKVDAAPDGEATLVDGVYELDATTGAAAKTIIERTGYGAFGDLNGDDSEDAAIVLTTDSGGSGTFYELAAVVDQDGDYVNVATAPLGDRIVVNDLAIEEGVILVDMIAQGPDDPMCCPTQHVLRSYVLEGDALTLTNEVELPAITSAGGVFQPEADPLAATLTPGGANNYWLNPTLVSILGGVAVGTPVEANTLGVTCAGSISERPDVVLEWAQDDSVETLRIFMLSLGRSDPCRGDTIWRHIVQRRLFAIGG
jgi:hypothetical protein